MDIAWLNCRSLAAIPFASATVVAGNPSACVCESENQPIALLISDFQVDKRVRLFVVLWKRVRSIVISVVWSKLLGPVCKSRCFIFQMQ